MVCFFLNISSSKSLHTEESQKLAQQGCSAWVGSMGTSCPGEMNVVLL